MQMRALVGLCMWERHWHRMIENAEDNGELEDEGGCGLHLDMFGLEALANRA